MGILSGIMGNASEIDLEELAEELEPIIAPNEQITMGYKVIRDMFVFTDKRLILIDKQGLTGKKTEYLSIPFKSISRFSVETAGRFDLDAELKLWIGSDTTPMVKELKKGTDVVGIQKALAQFILG
ncbi:PH domain-containing protein [Thalassotalea fusca]